MAEALAVISVIASIVQLVDFSASVVHRLEEFHSHAGEVPKSFRHIKAELPLLNTTLQRIKEATDAGSVADGTRKALLPVIAGCQEQVAQLDNILAETLPEIDDGWRKRSKKAIISLNQDAKVESITKVLRNYIGILTFYYSAASSTLQPLTDAKLSKIRQWLSAPDPSANYQKALKQRQADTGLWFLESEQYARWKTDAASTLWLYGIPGCGKTILNSTVLQNVLQYYHDDPGKATAYFFFDFNDAQKQDPELMLRSLICQLSQQSTKIPAGLDTLFSSCENGQRQPSMYALLEVTQQMMQEFPQVYVVLDALDECNQRAELMDMLETIASWRLPNLHLLVTSRRERDIESSLEGFVDHQNSICLQSELVDRDIQRYVQQRLSDDKNLRKWEKDATIRQEIEDALMKGARGMFRWAVCQLDTLGKCRNRAMLRKSLATLPPTLDQTYDRILSAISEEDSEYAIRILQWLTFSARPLLVEEVAEVAAIDIARNPVFDRDEVLEDPLEALNICSSLITITTDNKDRSREPARQIVALAHYSVQEYLLSDRIKHGQARHYSMQDVACHDAITNGCLGYLLQFQQLETFSEEVLGKFMLARYSAEFWTSHARKIGERIEKTSQVAMELFSTENAAYLIWIRLCDPDEPGMKPEFQKPLGETSTPLYYAALLGLSVVVKLLLDKGADPNVQGGLYSNALQAASFGGHELVVKLLLDRGAGPSAQGGCYGNALQAASFGGHELVVKLLLDKGADPNPQGGDYYDTALQAASYGGHELVVKLLLDKGAEVNAQGGSYNNALQAASLEGHELVVKLLLDNGAEVNAQGGSYDNALQAASLRGHDLVVKLLLDNGAEVNAQGKSIYGNALHAASLRGHDLVVKLLLDNGAEVNAQGGSDGNALQAASYGGHELVARLLLDKGAEVNAKGGNHHGNALQSASFRGHEPVVKLLLDRGAEVNAQGRHYGNALQSASFVGNELVVKLLLDNSAEVNAQCGYIYGNALQTASLNGHEPVVKLLLNRGAEVNAQGKHYGNALQAASLMGHELVVKLLLDNGASMPV